MIVFGGQPLGGGGYINTGGLFNPSTNSWTDAPTTDAPSGRLQHTAIWTGTNMIIFGGQGGSGLSFPGGTYLPR